VTGAGAAVALGALAIAAPLGLGESSAAGSDSGGPYRNGLIAFVRCCGPETGIYVIQPDGRGERRLFKPLGDDSPLDPAWSPDGTQVAFVPGRPRGGVWAMQAKGINRHRITPGRGDPLFPSWSPRGSWIVFADLGRRQSRLHDVYLVRTDGSGLKRLTRASAEETHPAWAPNGGEIVYERGRDLWRMRLDGSKQRLLVRDAHAPSWSPGGTHIAFLRGGDPWVVRRDGTGGKRVVDMRAEQAGIAWSPDGTWLVTAPSPRGDLTLVRADGSETAPLTNARGYGHSWPSWQRLPG
jgi:Tol biopolymer transport system component